MSAASKTLELLNYFSPKRPEIGLSKLCRLAGRDKATTYRHLQDLEDMGFVEQDPVTKLYRLGPALLQLAHTREITVPRKSGVEAPLRELADATGETAHVSVLSGKILYNLLDHESTRHSIRVIVDIQKFPLHATSSGLCALAFGPSDLFEAATRNMKAFTPSTVRDAEALRAAVEEIRSTGFARTAGTFEADVSSLAVPVFDQTGQFAGAASVASVASRFTPEHERQIKAHLITASQKITHNWGGAVPENIENAWASAQAQPLEPESAQ